MEFGNSCLKVTPAHASMIMNLDQATKLEVIDNPKRWRNAQRKGCKSLVWRRFDSIAAKGWLQSDWRSWAVRKSPKTINPMFGHSEADRRVIEPKLSLQGSLKMEDITQTSIDLLWWTMWFNFIPRSSKTCIGLGWKMSWLVYFPPTLGGDHQIPAYYLPNGEYVVAKSKGRSLVLANQKLGWTTSAARFDPRWRMSWILGFSSCFWPISVFWYGGIFSNRKAKMKELNYTILPMTWWLPPEILFSSVARMITCGLWIHRAKSLFKNVYLTGIVRDKLAKRCPNPLGTLQIHLTWITQIWCRWSPTGMLFSSPAGKWFALMTQAGRARKKLCNKIWMLRLFKVGNRSKIWNRGSANESSIAWFESRFNPGLSRNQCWLREISNFWCFDWLPYKLILGRNFWLLVILRWISRNIQHRNRSSNLWSQQSNYFEDSSNSPSFMPFSQRNLAFEIKERSVERVFDFGFLAKKRGLILKSSKKQVRFLRWFPKSGISELRKECLPRIAWLELLMLKMNALYAIRIRVDQVGNLSSSALELPVENAMKLRGEGWRMLLFPPVIWWIWKRKKKILAGIGNTREGFLTL